MEPLVRELESIHARNMKANDYEKTLALLRALKAGTVTLDNVTMTADGWQLVEVPAQPPQPEEPDIEPAG